MHGVRRVAHQGQPLADHRFRELQPQGITPLGPGHLQLPQKVPEPAFHLGQETGFVQGHDRRRQVGPFGPDQGRLVPRPLGIAHQRQDGERPRWQEMFVGDEVVAMFVIHRADDPHLPVGPLGHPDCGVIPGFGRPAVGGDGQPGADSPAVGQCRRDASGVPVQGLDRVRGQIPDAVQVPKPAIERLSKVPVLDHVAEGPVPGFAVVVMKEKQGVPFGNPDVPDRRRFGGQRRPDPKPVQDPLGGQGNGRDPAIEPGIQSRFRVLGIDHGHVDSRLAEGRGEGRADQAAADDQHFGFQRSGFGGCWRFFGLAGHDV